MNKRHIRPNIVRHRGGCRARRAASGLAACVVLLAAAACSSDPDDDTAAATTVAAPAPTAATAPPKTAAPATTAATPTTTAAPEPEPSSATAPETTDAPATTSASATTQAPGPTTTESPEPIVAEGAFSIPVETFAIGAELPGDTFAMSGGVVFEGDVVGTSTFAGALGTADAAGAATVDVEHIFVGTVTGVGEGLMLFNEVGVSQADTSLFSVGTVVGVTGALEGMRGTITFEGVRTGGSFRFELTATDQPVTPDTSAIPAWTRNAGRHTGALGELFSLDCPPGGTAATVFGSRIYTDDSSICNAAVHAGLITRETGGEVVFLMTHGLKSYASTTANGVTSLGYGPWPGSFIFPAAPPGS